MGTRGVKSWGFRADVIFRILQVAQNIGCHLLIVHGSSVHASVRTLGVVEDIHVDIAGRVRQVVDGTRVDAAAVRTGLLVIPRWGADGTVGRRGMKAV